MPPESSRTLHPVFAATPKLPPPAQRKHLTQQEKVAAVILYMKGSWQQDELAAELGVSGSAISRVVRECKKSASDHSLKGILVCEYLRPTPGIAHRVENRGNKRPRVVKRGEQGAIARANAPATALRKIAPRSPQSVQEPAASEPAASEPAASEPAASEPVASEPANSHEVAS